jgi:hypothetical protein
MELAVAQVVLSERNAKEAAAWRRQMDYSGAEMIAVTAEEPGMVSKVVDFVQALRSARPAQSAPALAGDAA